MKLIISIYTKFYQSVPTCINYHFYNKNYLKFICTKPNYFDVPDTKIGLVTERVGSGTPVIIINLLTLLCNWNLFVARTL